MTLNAILEKFFGIVLKLKYHEIKLFAFLYEFIAFYFGRQLIRLENIERASSTFFCCLLRTSREKVQDFDRMRTKRKMKTTPSLFISCKTSKGQCLYSNRLHSFSI